MSRLLRHRTARLASGLAVLAAITIAVPALFLAAGRAILATANPVPTDVTVTGARTWVTGRLNTHDTVTALIRALLCLGWIAWAVMLTKITIALTTTATAIRPTGRPATARPAAGHPIPGPVTVVAGRGRVRPVKPVGAMDGLARWIATAIVTATVSLPAAPAVAAPLARPIPTTLTTTSTTAATTTGRVAVASSTAPTRTPEVTGVGESRVVRVEAGDSAETIAERHLGHRDQWRALFNHNQDRVVDPATGARWTEPWMLRAGWTLEIPTPTDHTTPAVDQTATVEPAPAAPPVGGPVVEVVAGDSLWALIETAIGDTPTIDDITAVAAANDGAPTADGTHHFNAAHPNLIHPGEHLDLYRAITNHTTSAPPASAVASPAEPTPPPATTPAPPTPPPVVEAPVASTAPEAPAAPAPVPASTGMVANPATTDTTATSASPATSAPLAPPTINPQPQPATTAPATVTATDGVTSKAPVLVGVTGSTILATGLWLALRRLRRRRGAIERAGALVPISPTGSDLERTVFAASDVAYITWVGQVLNELATTTPAAVIAAIELTEPHPNLTDPDPDDMGEGEQRWAGIEVLWAGPVTATPPADWQPTHEGWAWRRPYRPEETFERLIACGYPGLATIGRRHGNLVLVDLAAHGSLTITGPSAGDVARALALAWCADNDTSLVVVSPVGIDIDAADQLDRFEPLTPDHALTVARHETAIALTGPDGTGELRVIIIDAANPAAAELVAACQPGRAVAVIVIGDSSAATGAVLRVADRDGRPVARFEPGGFDLECLALSRHSAASLACLLDELSEPADPAATQVARTELDAQCETAATNQTTDTNPNGDATDGGLEAVDVGPAVATVVSVRDEPAPPATGPIDTSELRLFIDDHDEAAGDGLDSGPLALLRPRRYQIRIFGKVGVDGIKLRGHSESLCALLACARLEGTEFEQRVPLARVLNSLWPEVNGAGVDVSQKRLYNIVSEIRRLLPLDGDTVAIQRHGQLDAATYQLAHDIGSDLEELMAATWLARHVATDDAITLLRYGLRLARGVPFMGRHLRWAEPTDTGWAARAEAVVEQAVIQLIEHATTTGNEELLTEAMDACRRAITAPSERIIRLRLAFNTTRPDHRLTTSELRTVIDELEFDPSAELARLLATTVRGARSEA